MLGGSRAMRKAHWLVTIVNLYCVFLSFTDFSSLARFKAALKRIDLSKFLTYCID